MRRLWRDARVAPAYVAAVSALVALGLALFSVVKRAKHEPQGDRAPAGGIRGFVSEHGGTTIYLFKLARAASTFAIFALYIVDLVREGELLNLLLSITYVRSLPPDSARPILSP